MMPHRLLVDALADALDKEYGHSGSGPTGRILAALLADPRTAEALAAHTPQVGGWDGDFYVECPCGWWNIREGGPSWTEHLLAALIADTAGDNDG